MGWGRGEGEGEGESAIHPNKFNQFRDGGFVNAKVYSLLVHYNMVYVVVLDEISMGKI